MSKRQKWLLEKKYEEIGLKIDAKVRNKVIRKGGEDWFHFQVKSLISNELMYNKKTIITEAYFEKLKATADVFVAEDGVVIELEKNLTESKINKKLEQFDSDLIKDIIFIDLAQAPKNITKLKNFIKSKINILINGGDRLVEKKSKWSGMSKEEMAKAQWKDPDMRKKMIEGMKNAKKK